MDPARFTERGLFYTWDMRGAYLLFLMALRLRWVQRSLAIGCFCPTAHHRRP